MYEISDSHFRVILLVSQLYVLIPKGFHIGVQLLILKFFFFALLIVKSRKSNCLLHKYEILLYFRVILVVQLHVLMIKVFTIVVQYPGVKIVPPAFYQTSIHKYPISVTGLMLKLTVTNWNIILNKHFYGRVCFNQFCTFPSFIHLILF